MGRATEKTPLVDAFVGVGDNRKTSTVISFTITKNYNTIEIHMREVWRQLLALVVSTPSVGIWLIWDRYKSAFIHICRDTLLFIKGAAFNGSRMEITVI